MTPGERFKKWIDTTAEEWKDRLRGWMASWLAFGLEILLDVIGKAFAPKLKPMIDTLEKSGEVPPELQPLLAEIKTPAGEAAGLLGSALGYSVIGGAMGKITDAIFNPLAYWMGNLNRNAHLALEHYLALRLRGEIDDKTFSDVLHQLNLSDTRIGWLKELSKIIPPLADMVRFADFSAFDPEVIAKWRQFYDAPSWITDPMSLIGISNEAPRDWANKYWFSHYLQPGRYELGEIYRRGLLGKPLVGAEEIGEPGGEGEAEKAVKLAYRTMGYSAYWQDLLLQLVRSIPTRVDVRRWWDMRTITEAELRSIYQRQGYFGRDLENYVLWTKVYVAFPDLIARYKNEWITVDDVRSELTALGMPADRVDEMIETKIKVAKPERVIKERDLTKSEIIRGIKKGIITDVEGSELLQDMGYDAEEVWFIIDANIAAEAGSPETFEEFKKLTQEYRIAVGMEAKPMTEELKKAGEEVIRLTNEVETLQRSIEEERAGLVEEEILPAKTTARLKKLQVALHRAEAELAHAKSEYDRLVAEWRHGG